MYAMPVSVESSMLSTMIAAALVYAPPTLGPIDRPNCFPTNAMRDAMSDVTRTSSPMMHDV